MLWLGLAFVLADALLVAFHVRRTQRRGGEMSLGHRLMIAAAIAFGLAMLGLLAMIG